MNKQSVEQKIRAIAEQVARESNLELVQTEIVGAVKNKTIRIFIDKPAGITHEDCAMVSTQVGEQLEREDFIPTAYILEVSSPGLERGLYSLKDFEKFSGKMASVKTYKAINGQKHYSGKIIGVKGEEIIFEDKTNGRLSFPYSSVAKANLEIDIEQEFKKDKSGEG